MLQRQKNNKDKKYAILTQNWCNEFFSLAKILCNMSHHELTAAVASPVNRKFALYEYKKLPRNVKKSREENRQKRLRAPTAT